jgi:2-succinyl-6-hydroxy-2,4-cyclohexadiene-1-carboxylate synthase
VSAAVPRKLAVRDIEMEIEEAGAGGRAFVLVHGFTGSRDDFRERVPELASLGRTIALDQRGHGGTTNSGRAEDYTLEALVSDLAAAFDALGLAEADLLGHSLGGMVALRFTLAHPERVSSLVLMDTSPRPMPLPIPESARLALGRLAHEQGVAALLPSVLRRPLEDLAPARRRSIEEMGEAYWDRIRRKLEAMDPMAWQELLGVLCSHEPVTDRLGEIRCPTTVLVGEQDAAFLAPADELERGIGGAVRVTIPDAEHSPQLENPVAWSEAIRAHLARAR